MGVCLSCCRGSEAVYVNTPDDLEKRQKMVEAAEKRKQEQERRGIQDPCSVRRKLRKSILNDAARDQANGDEKLRVPNLKYIFTYRHTGEEIMVSKYKFTIKCISPEKQTKIIVLYCWWDNSLHILPRCEIDIDKVEDVVESARTYFRGRIPSAA